MSFFDYMKVSVSLAGLGASQKVSCTADTMKLKNEIRENEKEIERLTYEVGRRCVERHLPEENSEYEELFLRIRRCQAENEDHRAEIQRLAEAYEKDMKKRQEQMKYRQEQREKERLQKEEAKQKQEEFQREQEVKKQQEMQRILDETTKICEKCKMRNDLDARFCVYCGNPIIPEESEIILQEVMTEIGKESADAL